MFSQSASWLFSLVWFLTSHCLVHLHCVRHTPLYVYICLLFLWVQCQIVLCPRQSFSWLHLSLKVILFIRCLSQSWFLGLYLSDYSFISLSPFPFPIVLPLLPGLGPLPASRRPLRILFLCLSDSDLGLHHSLHPGFCLSPACIIPVCPWLPLPAVLSVNKLLIYMYYLLYLYAHETAAHGMFFSFANSRHCCAWKWLLCMIINYSLSVYAL